jgi:hypothetical protein
MDTPAPQARADNVAALAPTHVDVEDLVLKVTFLEGELAMAHHA